MCDVEQLIFELLYEYENYFAVIQIQIFRHL